MSKYGLQVIPPIAPGAVSSSMAAIIGYLIKINFGSEITLLVGVLFGFVGLSISKVYIKNKLSKDPKEVVIDEFSGQMLASSVTGVSRYLIHLLLFYLYFLIF